MNFPGCYPQPNQKQRIWLPYKLHTRLRSSSASSVLASFYIAKVNSFKNNLYFFSKVIVQKEPHQPQDTRYACLLHLALPLVVETTWPRTWTFFWLEYGSINPFFQSDKSSLSEGKMDSAKEL